MTKTNINRCQTWLLRSSFCICVQENGHVVVEFDIGNEVERLVAEDTAWLNDSEYHTVLFEHSGMGDDSLRVDDYQMTRITSGSGLIILIVFNSLKFIIFYCLGYW